MAIPIEGYSVVVRRKRIQHLLDVGKIEIRNSTAIADDDLWRCSFMIMEDASKFARSLEALGLNASRGPDSDAVIVSEFDLSIEPYCEWLNTSKWEKAVIAWLAGTEPRTVVAPEGWDPKVGSGLTYSPGKDQLEFLRVEGQVEVYRDKQTGKEVYIGRTSMPVEALFKSAGQIITNHLRSIDEPVLTGADAAEVASAIAMLDQVLAEVSDEWRAYWMHGKGHLALGNLSAAYDSFTRAYALEKNEQAISRELAGVCLELGKYQQAVELAERAVSLQPDNDELLSNLALAHLLAGNIEAAQKTICAALKIDSSDSINQNVAMVIQQIANGSRPLPKSMRDLTNRKPQERHERFVLAPVSQPLPPIDRPRKKFWQFWKK